MKYVRVYFTQEEYNNYLNGEMSIGYTEEQFGQLKALQEVGFDVGLKTLPLNHMTKVPPGHISDISWSDNGVYVCRPRKGNKVSGF